MGLTSPSKACSNEITQPPLALGKKIIILSIISLNIFAVKYNTPSGKKTKEKNNHIMSSSLQLMHRQNY